MTTGHCGEGTGETAPWTRAWLPRSAVFRSAHDPFPEWRAGAVQTQQDGNVSNYSLPISPLPVHKGMTASIVSRTQWPSNLQATRGSSTAVYSKS